MFRKLVILLFVVFFMVLIIFTAIMFLKNEVEVYSDKEVTLAIEKPMFINLSESVTTEKGSDRTVVYDMSLLGLNVGTYTLVERTLENGTSLIFEEIENTGWIPYALSLNVKNLAESEFKSWNPEAAASLDEEIYGPDPTTNPYGVFTRGNTEILQGNVFVSRNLQLGNGDWVQELRHEIPEFTLEEGVLAKNYWLPPKHQSQTWMMIGQEPLFETEEAEDGWITFSLENRLAQLNWLTPEGPLVKLQLTDDPRTQLAYGYTTDQTANVSFIEWNENFPSLFFESMMLNSENDYVLMN
ncbi:hypothetical protein FQ085_14465 [Planococcus sp. ANT_H30]|uniref:hypothetical protein n=1 Tax=Planococcus sp. ANT_H30 TaxID=2597347 RepID=UPI0011EC0977|nr:hypothetical protein [Planococcus sp. ANT_H30]KAA0956052.1 hypothetical protein FQ085_14465 [Planococcus sp. ANT_H30]